MTGCRHFCRWKNYWEGQEIQYVSGIKKPFFFSVQRLKDLSARHVAAYMAADGDIL